MMLAPDTVQPAICPRASRRHFTDGSGKTLMFAHGFNIHYETIVPPAASTSR